MSSRLPIATPKSLRPSGKTNRPIVSADKLGNKPWATRCPTARGSVSSPAANPLVHRSSSEEIAVTTTEKLDSSASFPSIVPSAEQPVRGAPAVVSRTAPNNERWSYPIEPNMKTKSGLDEVWLGDARLLQCLLGGLTPCDARIVVIAHADAGFGSQVRTSSCLLRTYLSLGRAEQHFSLSARVVIICLLRFGALYQGIVAARRVSVACIRVNAIASVTLFPHSGSCHDLSNVTFSA